MANFSFLFLEKSAYKEIEKLKDRLENSSKQLYMSSISGLIQEIKTELEQQKKEKEGDEYLKSTRDFLLIDLENFEEAYESWRWFMHLYIHYRCIVSPRYKWIEFGYLLEENDFNFLEKTFPVFYKKMIVENYDFPEETYITEEIFEGLLLIDLNPSALDRYLEIDKSDVNKIENSQNRWLANQLHRSLYGEIHCILKIEQ
ncbi:hypothetical protein WAF17_20070 [Bernardetia sp. ABR2-2B]|uniref:hypothetical protein n=1 Tax=Bernardetia sp. ABR2-2B TaxID=3127472 RepID=UPI0030D1237A